MDHNRLKQLAGISETDDENLDAELAAYDAKEARHAAMHKKVRSAFASAGIQVDSEDTAVNYDEEKGMVEVTLAYMSGGYPLSLLEKLRATQLADDYVIAPGDMELEVSFPVK